MEYFLNLGYGIMIPDLLGSGNTSKPLDVNVYIGKSIANDIVAILDHEGVIGDVAAIAHDWGTYLLSQLTFYHDARFCKYVFLSVPHTMPGRFTDLEKFNKMTMAEDGYEKFGYQLFLGDTSRAGRILGKNWEAFHNMIYPADPGVWKTHMAPTGALENYLTIYSAEESKRFGADWVTEEDGRRHHEAFGDNYEATVKWYERGNASLGVREEIEMLKNGKIKNGGRIGKETLMVCGLRDAVCGAERARGVMGRVVEKGLLKVSSNRDG